jgi:hypothetical protein
VIAPGIAAVLGVVASVPATGDTVPAKHAHPNATVKMSGVFCQVGLLLHQGKRVYAAIPASCTALPTDEGTVQNGCVSPTAPVGSPARIKGLAHRTILVYNSFSRMQLAGEKRKRLCDYNDFALLKLSKADAKSARGAIPGLKAPTSISAHSPKGGSSAMLGHSSATVGDVEKGGWVITLSATPAGLRKGDVGTPLTQGSSLIGMFGALSSGTLTTHPAAVYSTSREFKYAKKAAGFHHLALLRAGQKL